MRKKRKEKKRKEKKRKEKKRKEKKRKEKKRKFKLVNLICEPIEELSSLDLCKYFLKIGQLEDGAL